MPVAARAVHAALDGGIDAADRLIVALDFPTVDDAYRVVDQLGTSVRFYKIGLQLQFAPKLRKLFKRLVLDGKKIFLDFKYIDIPATIEGVVRAVSELDIKFVTVIGQAPIVEAAIKGKGNSSLEILAVTLLTGMSEEDMRRAYSTDLSLEDFVITRAKDVIGLGCDGLISSPREVKVIRDSMPNREFTVVTPGIRPLGADKDDQKRIATPYEAVASGADYLVVGRPITRHRQPAEVARGIIDQMQTAFDEQTAYAE